MRYLNFLLQAIRGLAFFFATLLIAMIWLPSEVYIPAHNSTMIQMNDHIFGFVVQYHSSYFPCPFYAYKTVALSGNKQIGFTPSEFGEYGVLHINYSGFVVLCIVTALIIAVLFLFLKYIPAIVHYICLSIVLPSQNVEPNLQTDQN